MWHLSGAWLQHFLLNIHESVHMNLLAFCESEYMFLQLRFLLSTLCNQIYINIRFLSQSPKFLYNRVELVDYYSRL